MHEALDHKAVAARIMQLAGRRGEGRTLCPSEVARSLASDWRPLMPLVREVAGRLAREGALVVLQQGSPVDPSEARGPIRLGLARPSSGE